MVGPDLQTIVHRLHRLASEGGAVCATDAELLRRFTGGRDTAAFELLVWRHGAMVLATCRRILRNAPDAEDAFQATFLALIRQARSVRRAESLGPWLHRVARRASLHARQRNLRREQVERSRPLAAPVSAPEPPDVCGVVDEEVDRLPERLRRAVVLCYLEGHTTDDAARLLGVPRGTVLSRLARARDRLRGRFLRRGLAPAAGLASVATGDALAVPLVELAVQNAQNLTNNSAAVAPTVAALTEGVVRSMVLGKMKITAASLFLGLAIVGTGTLLVPRPQLNAQPPNTGSPTETAAQKSPDEPRSKLKDLFAKDNAKEDIDIRRLQGAWKVEKIIERGKDGTEEGMRWTFGATTLTVVEGKGGPTTTMSYRVDSTVDPKTIDLTHGDRKMAGIYKFTDEGEKFSLRVSLPNGKGARPTDFAGTKDVTVFVLVPVVDKPQRILPVDANDLDALKRENERLLNQLAENVRLQKELQSRAVEMEQMAKDQRDRAVAERQLSEDSRRRAEAMIQQTQSARDQATAEAQALRAKYELVLKDKDTEIESLRSKMPLDKWDAGWSEIMLRLSGGWGIRILADGSGIYGYGGKFDDFCTFPAGTFSFGKVRRDALARATLDGEATSCSIELRRRNEQGALSAFTSDAQFVIGLITTAHARATTPSLDQRWAKSGPRAPTPTTGPGSGARP